MDIRFERGNVRGWFWGRKGDDLKPWSDCKWQHVRIRFGALKWHRGSWSAFEFGLSFAPSPTSLWLRSPDIPIYHYNIILIKSWNVLEFNSVLDSLIARFILKIFTFRDQIKEKAIRKRHEIRCTGIHITFKLNYWLPSGITERCGYLVRGAAVRKTINSVLSLVIYSVLDNPRKFVVEDPLSI